MGAASRYVEGVVPTFNGKISRYQGRNDAGDALDQVQSLLSGQVEMFPGRWIEALGSTMLAVGYGYTDTEEAENRAKKIHLEKHQVEGRAAWGNYDDVFRIESRGKWWLVVEGRDREDTEKYFEVLNRLTFRPIYTSPITVRFDVTNLEQLVVTTRGTVQRYLPSIEWERRGSHDVITKIRLEAPVRLLDDAFDEFLQVHLTYKEYGIKPWAEVRVRLRDFWWRSLLRFTLRASFQWTDWFEEDRGAERAWELSSALWIDWEKAGAFIVRLGVIYTRHSCLERVDVPCASYDAIQPSIKAIARF
jgi:hypothetical protein